MYAVIETGGKQYRVELGTELAVERLDATPGATINLERVLLVADDNGAQIGTPTVADALVTADVLRQDRGDKVIVFKYRPKARHRSKRGHRQEQTVLRIADIRLNGRSAADEAGKQEAKQATARKQAAAEAERKAAADQALAAKLAAQTDEQPAEPKARTESQTESKTSAKPKATRSSKPKADASEEKKAPAPKRTAAKADAAGEPTKKPTRARTPRSSTKKDE